MRQTIQIELPRWFVTVLGFIVIGMIALLAIAIGHARIIDVQAARMELIELELARGSHERHMLTTTMSRQRLQLVELQSWRVHLTTASRMGWDQAARYVREFPMELTPVYLQEGGVDKSFKP